MSKTFGFLASVTASTKRRPSADEGGIVGVPETNIETLSCTPLDPVDAELRESIPGLSGMQELLQTCVQGGLDIVEGDILVVGSVEYPIRAVADWMWRTSSDFVMLVVEDRK